jgi:4-hydroxy-3-methylbut-2-enyl diphosphate reductase
MRLAEAVLAREKGPVYTLGPLMHNPQEVERLRVAGLSILPETPEEQAEADIAGAWVVLRSHGVPPQIKDLLAAKGANIVDATCVMVEGARDSAVELVEQGYHLVIVGSPAHPEVRAIVAHAGRAIERSHAESERRPSILVTKDAGEAISVAGGLPEKVGVIAQTTIDLALLRAVSNALLPRTCELRVFNTICQSTSSRQHEAEVLAREVDVMLVVGGHNSSNTSNLRAISERTGTPTHHIETAEELQAEWLAGASTIGVIGGASTPGWVIDEVVAQAARSSQS